MLGVLQSRHWRRCVVRLVLATTLSCALSRASAEESVPLETIPVAYDHARLYTPGEQTGDAGPIVLGAGPHLFIDEYLIASAEGLMRRVNTPERDPKLPNPVVDGPEDGCFQPYMSILRDPGTGRFRIWFGKSRPDKNAGRSLLGYMESEDGIQWERPARVLDLPGEIQFGVAVFDEGPGAANPAQRYKNGWYLNDGLRVAASPDGLYWRALTPASVLLHNHDINGIYRDTVRNRYIAIASVYREGGPWDGKAAHYHAEPQR